MNDIGSKILDPQGIHVNADPEWWLVRVRLTPVGGKESDHVLSADHARLLARLLNLAADESDRLFRLGDLRR